MSWRNRHQLGENPFALSAAGPRGSRRVPRLPIAGFRFNHELTCSCFDLNKDPVDSDRVAPPGKGEGEGGNCIHQIHHRIQFRYKFDD